MKIKDVPQDLKFFKGTVVRDVNYAVDDEGHYQAVLSDGWTPKAEALDLTWDEIDIQCEEIIERIKEGESSPLEYHMVKNLMTVELLSDYTGFSKRTIRKHFKPEKFEELDEETLNTYAEALRITVEQLKQIPEK